MRRPGWSWHSESSPSTPEPGPTSWTRRQAGLFKFAGHNHNHEFLATSFRGEVVADPERLDHSSMDVTFDVEALKLSAKGGPPGDVPKVQEKMIGPDVLEVARFPGDQR